ncbi:glycosyltransferase [Ferruginibacter lapsinanis]|uniref:glycosyltransferase n=1 Tax=Ferruginibacter lapsinanis TaxID=563172 RepID=UPI001E4AFB51|nr:glycosyltransferase [Ferruginibacter lapsinanis]UEG50586.1 glycosyltransferase [Ferruginibacter lapsinanis]
MKISFVIPIFNNAATILMLKDQLAGLSVKNNWEYEIIFVNDCSRDNSLQILSSLKDHSTVIHLKNNKGQSTAVLMGLKFVTGNIAVAMDADLQDRPDFIPLLVERINDSTDVVFSGRSGRYEEQTKLISAKSFKFILHLLSRKRLPADACMFFAIKQSAIAPLLAYTGSKPYLLSLIAKQQLRCISIPYIRAANNLTKSNYTFIKRWKVGIKGIMNFFVLKEKDLPIDEYLIIHQNKD